MNGRGMAQKSLDLIETCREILEEIQPTTVRSVCYQLFTRRLIKNMSVNETGKVSRLLTKARENGDIPWEWIVDETREAERVGGWDGLGDYAETILRVYRRDFWKTQPRWIEVWSEKGTVRGVLAPVLNEFAVTFRVLHGFGSATALHDIAEETQDRGRLLEVFYVGDYDPSGLHMSEMDLPNRLERYEGSVILTRIALTRADGYRLPSFPLETKSKDPRHRFKRNFGDLCWEVDALNSNELRGRVRAAITSYIDDDAWEHCQKTEAAERESMEKFFKRWPRAST
jgi:hypothetical protein